MPQNEREELKEDKLVEYTLRAYDFVKNNLRLFITVVAVVVVLVAAFGIYQYQKQQKEAKASMAFGEALELFNEAEEAWKEPEKVEESEDKFKEARDKFEEISKEYASTDYGDEAFFYSAKCSYILGEYEKAVDSFQKVVKKYPDTIVSLFSQLAIGKCYEQNGEFEKAISAYDSGNFDEFRGKFPQYEYVVARATFRQAQCYEKLNQIDNAAKNYGIIINQFEDKIKAKIAKKSQNLLQYAKNLVDSVEGLNVRSEGASDDFSALIAYKDAIHEYKIKEELSPSSQLSEELRVQIKEFEKRTSEFIENVQKAKDYKSEGNMNSALYSYDRAVELDFPPGRKLYEEAKLQLDLINKSQKSMT